MVIYCVVRGAVYVRNKPGLDAYQFLENLRCHLRLQPRNHSGVYLTYMGSRKKCCLLSYLTRLNDVTVSNLFLRYLFPWFHNSHYSQVPSRRHVHVLRAVAGRAS